MKLEIDLSDVNVHIHLDQREAPRWAKILHDMVSQVLTNQEKMMSDLEDLNGLLTEIGTEVGKVSDDTDKLLADLAAIPTQGMTPEEKAAVSAAVVSATAIRDRLKALDDKVPDATA